MKRWKDLFRPRILERGLDYYMDDCVSALEKTESGYKAVVEGTENYDVEIVLRNEENYQISGRQKTGTENCGLLESRV